MTADQHSMTCLISAQGRGSRVDAGTLTSRKEQLDAVLAGKASAVTTTGLEAVLRFEHVALPEVS
ncbi:hypothetical protein DPM13_09180 [Paracoccus mutanolyticus]|uniref:Uncharacterized protein n=1 Tax=Paracoccus mutanolyticus TaxID=1499308 RepID=A0ABM6WRQ3_9RHOB|nr:hypothetical protein DPM13_09180 [Paracoccus mutanolyticus]